MGFVLFPTGIWLQKFQYRICFFFQVHFVPEGGTVAQIVYSDEQDRPSQQVVYTADGTSYTSVDTSEHTLVYIHPVEATQACVVLGAPHFGT